MPQSVRESGSLESAQLRQAMYLGYAMLQACCPSAGRRYDERFTALLDFFRAHRDDEALVLATIIATVGSTYRKPGAMMLVARDGSFEGLISGGCLEGDLLHHAAEVFENRAPKRVTYDMHADDDLVWSLGLGCDGIIHLQLQRLEKNAHFGFLERLEHAHRTRQPVMLALATRLIR